MSMLSELKQLADSMPKCEPPIHLYGCSLLYDSKLTAKRYKRRGYMRPDKIKYKSIRIPKPDIYKTESGWIAHPDTIRKLKKALDDKFWRHFAINQPSIEGEYITFETGPVPESAPKMFHYNYNHIHTSASRGLINWSGA